MPLIQRGRKGIQSWRWKTETFLAVEGMPRSRIGTVKSMIDLYLELDKCRVGSDELTVFSLFRFPAIYSFIFSGQAEVGRPFSQTKIWCRFQKKMKTHGVFTSKRVWVEPALGDHRGPRDPRSWVSGKVLFMCLFSYFWSLINVGTRRKTNNQEMDFIHKPWSQIQSPCFLIRLGWLGQVPRSLGDVKRSAQRPLFSWSAGRRGARGPVSGVPNRSGLATSCPQNPKAEKQAVVKQERNLFQRGQHLDDWTSISKTVSHVRNIPAGLSGAKMGRRRGTCMSAGKVNSIIILESITGGILLTLGSPCCLRDSLLANQGCCALGVFSLSWGTSWKAEPN